jgi:hypothetical protein
LSVVDEELDLATFEFDWTLFFDELQETALTFVVNT